MPIIKIVPMPGPSGSGQDFNPTVPFTLNDTDNNALLTISETGTGTTRIETPQDDLSLRSARDITLYAGNDGPGKVYIGWGDAIYTPDSGNEVATKGYVQDELGGIAGSGKIKYVDWRYPTQNAVAIQNDIDGEAISIKSSNSASVRWHVRDGGSSLADWGITANSIIQQTGENGVGPYQVQFAINELDFTPPANYFYTVYGNTPWDGTYLCTSATNTTITLEYPGPNLPGANEEFTGGTIAPPSVYTQVEANSNGVWIKNASWNQGENSYTNYWQFGNDGVFYGPSMGNVTVPGLRGPINSDLNIFSENGMSITANAGDMNFYMDGAAYIGDSSPNNRIARMQDVSDVTLGGATGSFVSQDGKTITVTNGIITGIA